jgi:response regulator of citrate/malate metabolism
MIPSLVDQVRAAQARRPKNLQELPIEERLDAIYAATRKLGNVTAQMVSKATGVPDATCRKYLQMLEAHKRLYSWEPRARGGRRWGVVK